VPLTVAARVLDDWDRVLERFVKVMPRDYKRVLEERKAAHRQEREPVVAQVAASG